MKIVNTGECLDDYLHIVSKYTSELIVKSLKEMKRNYSRFDYVEVDIVDVGDLENLLREINEFRRKKGYCEVELIMCQDNVFGGETYLEIYDGYRE